MYKDVFFLSFLPSTFPLSLSISSPTRCPFPSLFLELWNILGRAVSVPSLLFVCDSANTPFPPLRCSLEQLLTEAKLSQSAVVPASWQGGRDPQHTVPVITCQEVLFMVRNKETWPFLELSSFPPPACNPSYPVFHLIFLILFWWNIIIYEWAVITVSVNKWDVNTPEDPTH